LQSIRNTIADEDGDQSLVDKLFSIELQNEIKNKEMPEEPPQITKETVLKLSCHIDNTNVAINHMAESLKLSMEGEIEKYSEYAGKNCVYSKVSKINHLVRNTTD
jgi:hypothetical protein